MSGVTQQQMVEQIQAAREQLQVQIQATNVHHEAQLAGANAQILHLSQMLDAMRSEQERLRRDSETAYNDLEARSRGRSAGSREVSFVSTKSFEGGKFAGSKAENFKAWAKRVRIFCNAQASGMKKAMEAAEAQAQDVDLRQLGPGRPQHRRRSRCQAARLPGHVCGRRSPADRGGDTR